MRSSNSSSNWAISTAATAAEPVLSTNPAASYGPRGTGLGLAYNGLMNASIQPIQLLLVSVAGWMNRRQQEVVEYLVEENRVLEEQLCGRRLRLNDRHSRHGHALAPQADRGLITEAPS
jgi:hypothetical protein